MSVQDNLNSGAYKTQLDYPKQPRQPLLARGASAQDAREYADLLEQFEADMIVFRAARTAYYADDNALRAQFRKDLEAEYNMVGNPKADKLWAKAWAHGHSAGLGDVYTWYDDLYDLV